MNVEQIQAANQTQIVNLNNKLQVIVKYGAPITIPIALVFLYKYFMHGMNNSMTNFNKSRNYKAARKAHSWKLWFGFVVLIVILLALSFLKK